ncbi:MAG TPA: hypothetical protein VFJ06_04995 [Halococcus sp.]|nr:hypothetical protein [Halococcus sp.]
MSSQDQSATGSTTNIAAVAAAGSIAYALYLFYVQGKSQQGIFVGLWAPTILGLANHLEQTDLPEEIEEQAA